MKRKCSQFFSLLMLNSFLFASPHALAVLRVNGMIPEFSEMDSKGVSRSSQEFKNQWMVLEWINPDCASAKKFYEAGHLPKLQKTYAEKGIKWILVSSSAKQKPGFLDQETATHWLEKVGATPAALLLDADGSLGKLFDAQTTPQVFVVNPKGQLVYQGAIDNNDSTDPKTLSSAYSYLSAALDAGLKKRPVAMKITKPYGCPISY